MDRAARNAQVASIADEAGDEYTWQQPGKAPMTFRAFSRSLVVATDGSPGDGAKASVVLTAPFSAFPGRFPSQGSTFLSAAGKTLRVALPVSIYGSFPNILFTCLES